MNRQQYLLIKLAEEASEVAQIALKSAQFGLETTGPCQTKSNVELLNGELNDLMALVEMLTEEGANGIDISDEHIEAKKLKVNTFYGVSQNLGKVTSDAK
jgi:hypothetical protein